MVGLTWGLSINAEMLKLSYTLLFVFVRHICIPVITCTFNTIHFFLIKRKTSPTSDSTKNRNYISYEKQKCKTKKKSRQGKENDFTTNWKYKMYIYKLTEIDLANWMNYL